MGKKKRILKFNAWLDYNKVDDYVLVDVFYLKKPSTKHTNPDIVSRKFSITIEEL